MKKILLSVVLVVCMGVLSGCTQKPETSFTANATYDPLTGEVLGTAGVNVVLRDARGNVLAPTSVPVSRGVLARDGCQACQARVLYPVKVKAGSPSIKSRLHVLVHGE